MKISHYDFSDPAQMLERIYELEGALNRILTHRNSFELVSAFQHGLQVLNRKQYYMERAKYK